MLEIPPAEFGALLRRLATIARVDAPADEAELTIFGAARVEAQLFDALDGPTFRSMPLSHHAFARRIFASLGRLGFAPDQSALVLRAIFHPDSAEASEATRLGASIMPALEPSTSAHMVSFLDVYVRGSTSLCAAWLLLGGTDWGVAQAIDDDLQKEVHESYVRRRAESRRKAREEEKLRKAERAKAAEGKDSSPGASASSEGNVGLRGWAKLRQKRFGGMAAAAIAAAGVDAANRRRQRPAVLDYGEAPRKEEFTEWSTLPLLDYERLVSTFGDYQVDEEMRRCRGDLGQLFRVLDSEGGAAEGSGDEAAAAADAFLGGGDDISKLNAPELHGLLVMLMGRRDAPPLQHPTIPSAILAQQHALAARVRGAMGDAPLGLVDEAMHTIGEKIRLKQQKADEAAGIVKIGLSMFEQFIKQLRPLAPGEREGDEELLALTKEFGAAQAAAATRASAEAQRRPAWMGVTNVITDSAPSAADATQAAPSGSAQAGLGGLGSGLMNLHASLWQEGRVDVLGTLEPATKALIPLKHLPTIRLVLANLRTARFTHPQANVLVRALYSFADKLDGPAYRQEAWDLLREHRLYMRSAADALAGEVGEFRTESQKFRLPGVAALRGEGDGFGSSHAPQESDGLREDELQLLISLLGEHLSEGQRAAIVTVSRGMLECSSHLA